MASRLSCNISIFGFVFFVHKSLLGIVSQWSREKFAFLSIKPRSYVRVLIKRRWGISQFTRVHFTSCCVFPRPGLAVVAPEDKTR